MGADLHSGNKGAYDHGAVRAVELSHGSGCLRSVAAGEGRGRPGPKDSRKLRI